MSNQLSMEMNRSASPAPVARLSTLSRLSIGLAVIIVGLLIYRSFTAEPAHHAAHHGPPPILAVAPFVGILLSIAILPLVPATHHWWENNHNKLAVSLAFAAATLVYYLFVGGVEQVVTILDHAILWEYIPFIVLLFSLYAISGGISLSGDLAAHPTTNTAFLGIGALIASFIGTTGASMLLIRPLLQTNSERKHVVHTVIFFIFLVSNIGGSLLPVGDPPLFLGYLKGVPFLWTLGLWKPWLFCCVILLGIYFVWDTLAYRRELKRDILKDETQRAPLVLRGTINMGWLAGVVLAAALIDPSKNLPLIGVKPFPFLRELVMLAFVGLSLRTTPGGVREANKFNYVAILEVAALFIGIFIAMQVPIEILNARGASLGLERPWQFFWATGALSSFLDNAPTYVVFFETANAMTHSPGPGILQLLSDHFIRVDLLVAISLGAVFMGANTYIGNGPNFMVKSIAEQSGVKMPSFFGYMLYSVVILVPLFLVVTLVFLR